MDCKLSKYLISSSIALVLLSVVFFLVFSVSMFAEVIQCFDPSVPYTAVTNPVQPHQLQNEFSITLIKHQNWLQNCSTVCCRSVTPPPPVLSLHFYSNVSWDWEGGSWGLKNRTFGASFFVSWP